MLQVLIPLLSTALHTNCQVWYRNGGYQLVKDSPQLFDTIRNVGAWTLVLSGNFLGTNDRKVLALESNFLLGEFLATTTTTGPKSPP